MEAVEQCYQMNAVLRFQNDFYSVLSIEKSISELLCTVHRPCTTFRAPAKRGFVQIENDPKKRGAGKTVLVVDDNAAIRRMLAYAFLSDGFKTCAEAGDGQEAIEVAKRIKPDIVILDLSMPVMDGLAAASELRKVFPPMPIILFTVYEANLFGTTASDAGVNLVLPKTVPLSRLIGKAHELIGN